MRDLGWDLTWEPSPAALDAYRTREVELCAANRRALPGLRLSDMLVTTRTFLDASPRVRS